MKKNPEDIVNIINKAAGKDIASYGKDKKEEKIEALPTGILPLDLCTGINGLPKGRIVEVSGLPSCGKSTLCLGMIANNQKEGLTCAYIDAEYALDLDYAANLGVDVDSLIIIQPDSGEEAFEAIERLVRDKAADIIIVDSVSALSPKAELEAETGRPTMGAQARLMAQGLRKIVSPLAKSGTILFFINQLRMNIMGGQYDPYVTPGGMSLRFYTSVRMEIKRKNQMKVGEETIGYEIEIKISKNKVGKPMGIAKTHMVFGEGFSAAMDLLMMATEEEVVTKQGNTYLFKEEKIGVGLGKATNALKSNPELFAQILSELQQLQTQ